MLPQPCAAPLWLLPPQRFPRSLQHRPGDSSRPRLGSASAGDPAALGLRALAPALAPPPSPAAASAAASDPQSAAPEPGRPRGRRLPCRGLPFLPVLRRGPPGPGPSHRRGPGLGLQLPRPGGSNGWAQLGLGKRVEGTGTGGGGVSPAPAERAGPSVPWEEGVRRPSFLQMPTPPPGGGLGRDQPRKPAAAR